MDFAGEQAQAHAGEHGNAGEVLDDAGHGQHRIGKGGLRHLFLLYTSTYTAASSTRPLMTCW